MTDERLRLTRDWSGQPEFRINLNAALALGKDWLTSELDARGYEPEDLGEAYSRTGTLHIPIRRDHE